MVRVYEFLFLISIIFAVVIATGEKTETESPNPTCVSNSDCNHGKCENTTCVCESGYVTYKGVNCNYKQKEKLVAFLLSFFIGNFGADWFYLANGRTSYIVLGVIKLLTGFMAIGFSCCFCFAGCMRSDGSKVAFFVLIVLLVSISPLVNIAWWLADWIRILLDTFLDGNNIGLKPW